MARKYIKSSEKLAANKQHLIFNLRAKRYGLTPRSLQVKPLVNNQQGRHVARQTGRKFLLARISQIVSLTKSLEQDLHFAKRELEYHLQPQHFSALEDVKEKAIMNTMNNCKKRQKRKFDLLLCRDTSSRASGCSEEYSERWVVNHSSGSKSQQGIAEVWLQS